MYVLFPLLIIISLLYGKYYLPVNKLGIKMIKLHISINVENIIIFAYFSFGSTGSRGHVSIEELCMGSGCGPLPLIMSTITSSILMLDLTAHQDALLLAGNMIIGMYGSVPNKDRCSVN